MPKNMPQALSTHSYRGFSGRIKNIGYVHRKEYDLGRGVMVKLEKEQSKLTQYAGWGLQAVTDIPKGFVLGYFVLKKEAKEPEEGTYNIRKPNGRYLVMEHDSLMNRINTIAQPKARHRLCNCKIGNSTKGKVSVTTTKKVPAGAMLWVKYGTTEHYWDIQYSILKKRLRGVKATSENDDSCRGCRKRHVPRVVCDSCPRVICSSCLSPSEKYILARTPFFCKKCMENPPAYMNRFSRHVAAPPPQYATQTFA